ncbi:hypothetical protein F5B22DRAFT_651997 [Xylaria bambusicola]|uniref:uncharacterized protein n=1 Tax=Xylaria bambusicola TaxID=326684 RepID=UPI002008E7E5|nr:uncharacterized protein F5B22DRAFT_651997 [Xylaria bambusicola]KAI0505165.1 hypothetical protein F5B22DRAFT_651997 [Xylaria bambusicola]
MSQPAGNPNNADHETANATSHTIASKAVARAHGMLVYSQRQVDRVVSPSTRQRAMDSTTDYAAKRPLLSLFIAIQILSALVPALLFTTFITNTLLVALLSALAFTLFWTLVALFVLIPTLLITCGFAILLWVWAVGSYIFFRAIYSRLPPSLQERFQSFLNFNSSGDDENEKKRVIFHHKDYDLDEAVAAEVAEARA